MEERFFFLIVYLTLDPFHEFGDNLVHAFLKGAIIFFYIANIGANKCAPLKLFNMTYEFTEGAV